MTTVEALKDLYVALGGDLADVQDMSTNVAVLNAISAKYNGASDAVLNPEAVANIAAIAGDIGGGVDKLLKHFGQVTFTATGTSLYLYGPVFYNENNYPAWSTGLLVSNGTPYTYDVYGPMNASYAELAVYNNASTKQPVALDNITVTGNVTKVNGVLRVQGNGTVSVTVA